MTENEFLLLNYSYIEHQSDHELYCVQRIHITYNGIQWHTYHKFIIQFSGDIKQSALIFFISASYDYNNTNNNNDCGEDIIRLINSFPEEKSNVYTNGLRDRIEKYVFFAVFAQNQSEILLFFEKLNENLKKVYTIV